MSFESDTFFEDEVRRIARARWPAAAFDGAAMIGGRERDGLFETEEVVHFVEATTSKRADKAKEDTKKLFSLISSHQRSDSVKGAVGWFVTQLEPTADQREAVRTAGKNQVKCVSFAQFQQAVIDVPDYFAKRENHLFGSVADPTSGDTNFQGEYLPLEFLSADSADTVGLDNICSDLREGKSYVMLGDYGAGKSMTLRELYYRLRNDYRAGSGSLFPAYINLREHSGQDDPSELLERHARKIGFDKPGCLVSAWRAGFVILLIDGFDEITSLGISARRDRLKEARRRSLEAVRQLISQTPRKVGFVVAGREHFFSTPAERGSALGIRKDTQTLLLGELNPKQVAKYIKAISGEIKTVPDWVPTRPLLLSYLITRGIFQGGNGVLASIDAIDGWNLLLDDIFDREAKISPSLDGPTLRSILERLATMSRATPDGMGPLSQAQIKDAYRQICDAEPDDQADLLLQRLPGLGIYRHEDESRTFVDVELAGVCRSKDILDFIINPHGILQDEGWKNSMRSVNAFAGKTAIVKVSRSISTMRSTIDADGLFHCLDKSTDLEVFRGDVAMVCIESSLEPRRSVHIDNAMYEQHIFSPAECITNLSNITFKNCIFDTIEVGPRDTTEKLPIFEGCIFSLVADRVSKTDMPPQKFDTACEFEKFAEHVQTQNSIMSAKFSIGEKLVLTILRKVFMQSLSGRSESALVRGLDLNQRALVPDAVKLLHQAGLLTPYYGGDGNVWIPVRKKLDRVRNILASPSTCGDEILIEAKRLFSK